LIDGENVGAPRLPSRPTAAASSAVVLPSSRLSDVGGMALDWCYSMVAGHLLFTFTGTLRLRQWQWRNES
jgi:hypothetical protein